MKIFLYFDYIFIISIIKINLSLQSCFEYSCKECSSPEYGKCTKCRSTFTLIEGTCPCSSSECALCTTGFASLQICEHCKNGYYNEKKDCFCLVDNCEQCAEDGCKKCISGYSYNETLKKCIKQSEEEKIQCYDPNCDGCFSEQQGACEYCKNGYYLKKGECLKLKVPTNGVCPTNHYKNGKYCYERCSGIRCNYWLILGFLSLCPENHCLICEFNVLQLLGSCDNSAECSSIEGCLNCITTDECFLCKTGYYLLGGICKKCSEGCSICSSESKCEYCLSGYELTINNTCKLTNNFDFNVDIYEAKKNKLISINFPEEFNIEPLDTKDISDISSEIPEISNYPTNLINNKTNILELLLCDINCVKCFDNTGVCIQCDSGYNLIENKCILKCSDKNCLSCKLKDNVEICSECPFGYSINKEKCELNCSIDNCFECSMNGTKLICSKCNNGYFIEDNSCKIQCKDNNCKICSENDGLICSQCKDGYYLENNTCKIICEDNNCNKCSENNGSICQECKDGYYLDENICKIICEDNNCNICSENDGSICMECKDGYYIDENNCKIQCQDINCNNCSENSSTCVECKDNYYLEGNICKIKCADENCDICFENDTSICSQCKDGYYLEANTCKIQCEDINCKNCSENSSICSECLSGYYLNGNICKMKCIDKNCNTCTQFGIVCSECKSGFYLDGINCFMKCKDNNCIFCPEDISVCTECKINTKLYNEKCALSKGDCHSKFKNCNYCLDEEGCIECNEGFEIDNKYCIQKKNNFTLYIILIIIVLLIILGTIIFLIHSKKRQNIVPLNTNIPYDQQSDVQSENPQVIYNIRNNLDLAFSKRSVLSREEAAEEFETQRLKSNKARMACMYCLKKPGIYKCDCGCVVCKEHSLLKDIEKNGIKYKGCYRCEKIVKKVTPIKKECNICLQKKNVLVHFKCGCAFEVCKNCYIKIKTTGNKCPGCRGLI